MPNVVVVGAQWGDEGKGRIIDLVTPAADVVVRFQGGANAGHTVVIGSQRTILHLVPSGILHERCRCIIASGVVVDPGVLIDEIEGLSQQGYLKDPSRLVLSRHAHLVMPYHRQIDQLREEAAGSGNIGTTGRGIGPAYEDRAARIGIRAGDLLDPDLLCRRLEAVLPHKNQLLEILGGSPMDLHELQDQAKKWSHRLGRHVMDAEEMLHGDLRAGRRVLFEGAQGAALDVDHGTYPFVTSSNTVAGAACTGAGVGPTAIDRVLGVVKAYATRVGNGPFPTELADAVGERLQLAGKEFGSTTGRRRRCGWFDAILVRHAVRLSGITEIALTKLDVLSGIDPIRICTSYECGGRRLETIPALGEEVHPIYEELLGWEGDISSARRFEDLPARAQEYVRRISELTGCEIAIISVGSERQEHIMLKNIF